MIPQQLTKALVIHSEILQTSNLDGEASGSKFQTNYVWHKTWKGHLKSFIPAQAENNEFSLTEWLTVQNISDWIDNHKNYIIDIGFVKNQTG